MPPSPDPLAPAAEPSMLHLTLDGDTGAGSVGGSLVGNLAGMTIHIQLTGEMTVRPDAPARPARGAAAPFGSGAGELSTGESEAQAEGAWDVIKDVALGGGGLAVETVRDAHEAARRRQAKTALVRTIPDDPDWAKHVPVDYRLNAKELVDYLLEDLHKATAGDELERAKTAVEFADWGIALAEMFEVAGAAALFGPVLAVAGLALSLGAGYAGANEAIAIREARDGFSFGVVASTQGMSAAKIQEHWGDTWTRHGAEAADNANTISKTYRLGGLGAGFLQGRRLSANQRTVFWHDLQRRYAMTKPDPRNKPEWGTWAGVFQRNHLEAD